MIHGGKGEGKQGIRGGEEELQKLVSQEARAVTGCFRTTNLGALMAEASLRLAVAQLDNRQRRFASRWERKDAAGKGNRWHRE